MRAPAQKRPSTPERTESAPVETKLKPVSVRHGPLAHAGPVFPLGLAPHHDPLPELTMLSAPLPKQTGSPEAGLVQRARKRFAAETIVSPINQQEIPSFALDAIQVTSVKLPEHRLPTKKGKEQGRHVLAWVLMLPYWERYFTGAAHTVIGKLHTSMKDDEQYDLDRTTNKGRELARYYIDQLLTTKTAPLKFWKLNLSKAIKSYIVSHNISSFATFGHGTKGTKYHPGHALKRLKRFHKQLDNNVLLERADVLAKIAKLFDKPQDDRDQVKGAQDLTHIMQTYFPKFFNILGINSDNIFAVVKVKKPPKGKTIDERDELPIDTHEVKSTKKETIDEEKEMLPNPEQPKEISGTEGWGVELGLGTINGKTYGPNEVKLIDLRLSKGRQKTGGRGQGRHTIPWGFHIEVLEALRTQSASINDLLNAILLRIKFERKWAIKGGELWKAESAERRRELVKKVQTNLSSVQDISSWEASLSDIFREYVQIYQLSPFATFREVTLDKHGMLKDDKPVYKGEATAMQHLRRTEKELQDRKEPTATPETIEKCFRALMDIPQESANRKRVNVDHLTLRWREDLSVLFPLTVKEYKKQLQEVVPEAQKPVSRGSQAPKRKSSELDDEELPTASKVAAGIKQVKKTSDGLGKIKTLPTFQK